MGLIWGAFSGSALLLNYPHLTRLRKLIAAKLRVGIGYGGILFIVKTPLFRGKS